MRFFALFLIAAGTIAPLVLPMIAVSAFPGLGVFGFVSFALAIALPCFIWAVRILRRTKPIDESTSCGNTLAGFKSGKPEDREFNGVRYTVLYSAGSSKEAPSLSVSTSAATTPDAQFMVTPKTWFDQLSKRIGLTPELQTGATEFDDTCYVRSSSDRFVHECFCQADNRAAVMNLKRLGFQNVALRKNVVTASSTWPKQCDANILPVVEEAARTISFLGKHLPAFRSDRHPRAGAWQQAWAAGLWAFLVAYGALFFWGAAFPPFEFSKALAPTATLVAIVFPVFVIGATAVVRGSSTSHDAWKWLMLGALILLPLGSAGVLMRLNGELDESPEVTHAAKIIDKGISTGGKGPASYWVRYQSWNESTSTKNYRVSKREWGKVVPNESQMVVVTRAGWLGIEWKVASWIERQ